MKHSEKAVKNSVQKAVNDIVLQEWEIARKEIDHKCGVRLRSCTAWVYESENYYFLRSYNTIVAFIHKETKTCYDVLRYVYGYTATSAQHIAKFWHDYTPYPWNNTYYIWRNV
ncbi:MAG: hypothetical protein J6S67_01475 [Methanobrevibacter sp.]|nr:hypothetical protein [Methanobrevibacter sp.]